MNVRSVGGLRLEAQIIRVFLAILYVARVALPFRKHEGRQPQYTGSSPKSDSKNAFVATTGIGSLGCQVCHSARKYGEWRMVTVKQCPGLLCALQ